MRQVRWAELLKQYKFTIYYTFNKDNGRVDALNKKSEYITTEKESFALLAERKNEIFINTTA